MSPILSAIIISTLSIIFFSFLSIKIDHIVKWNWFLVFVPLFILKFCFAFDCIILIIHNRVKSTLSLTSFKFLKLIIFLIEILLALTFEILLCLKLQYYYASIKLTYVFIPFWLFSFILLVYLFKKLTI